MSERTDLIFAGRLTEAGRQQIEAIYATAGLTPEFLETPATYVRVTATPEQFAALQAALETAGFLRVAG